MVTFKLNDLGSGIGVTHIIDDDGINRSVQEIDREPNQLAEIKDDHSVTFHQAPETTQTTELDGTEVASDNVYKSTDGFTM